MRKRSKNPKIAMAIEDNEFFKYIAEDIVERLCTFDFLPNNILSIEGNNCLTKLLINKFPEAQITCISPEGLLDQKSQSFDIIISMFHLHWISDVEQLLSHAYHALKSDGVFIGNFAGGGTLRNLRALLVEAEIQSSKTHSPHISPFIHFDHISPLLQRAGFAEIIADYEIIELEFETPYKLMKTIQNLGHSNALVLMQNYAISKSMLEFLKKKQEAFLDQINLITFVSSRKKHSLKLKR